MTTFRIGSIAMAVALGSACATYPKPVDSLAASEASLRTANQLGAKEVPPAALQYQLATEELARAETLIKDGENEKADQMLSRSRADAELAIALTNQAKAQNQADAEAQQLKDSLRKTHATQ
jgi:hypothetical protein